MPKRLSQSAPSVTALCVAALVSGGAAAESTSATLDALVDSREIPVTVDNFTRAATDAELDKYVSLAGGVNEFFHFRTPTPVENQPTIRMNRDTLYSTAVVDISEGATLTLPEVGGRYMTAMIVNQHHYINEVYFGGGTYTLDTKTFDTPYVIVFMRVLVDASDPDDVAAVNAIQDAMMIEAASSKPFISPDYNQKDLEDLISETLKLGRFAPDATRTFGPKSEVDPLRHFIGTAVGWGGLPETEAFYLSVEPNLPVGTYKIDVPADVPVGAFWSVSLYNAAGFFEENARDAYNVNSITGTPNDDGSMTVHLGGCDTDAVNCLPIMDGWNYTVRLYRPGPEVLDGSWTFPAAQPVN
ncbi:DUF1214 domain-containing protein [Ruegeria atlantica]|uniref:DUF1214 domain-containing protein n=1 Tax=Ruegeria atlantica TaxID=81569 RepID=UPI0024941F2C|nr:DUF1214 domain-containing protein [Ruegeria atlantica]